jgi:hypothetical protein
LGKAMTPESSLFASHWLRVSQRGLSCGKSSDWHTKWTATDIVQSNAVTKINGGRITTMLATDTNFQVFLGATTFLDTHLDELSNTCLIE